MAKKLLICEDDSLMMQIITKKLTQEGYDVDRAEEGKTAIEKLSNTDYDLVITDLLMPYKDGLEVLEHLRNEIQKDTPVILLSNIGVEEKLDQAYELGADDYVTKPFSPKILIRKVNLLLKEKA